MGTGRLLESESGVNGSALGCCSFAFAGSYLVLVGRSRTGWGSFDHHEDIFPEDNLQEASVQQMEADCKDYGNVVVVAVAVGFGVLAVEDLVPADIERNFGVWLHGSLVHDHEDSDLD